MRELSRRNRGRIVAAVALTIAAIAIAAGNAFGNGTVNISTGENLFSSSGCGGCHTFKAMGAKGTIGPNLDKVTLTPTQWKTAISKGGFAVMTAAALAKYKFKMSPYAGRLTTAQIATLAGFLLAEENKPQLAGTGTKTTTTPACAIPGDCSGGGGGTTTTSGRPGSGSGGANSSGCPPGVTIPTSGNTDADGDEAGTEADDNDGCI